MNQDDVVLDIVTQFYLKATQDLLIGYHFRNIKNFDEHIPRIAVFWQIQLGLPPSHREAPFSLLKTHLPLQIRRGQMERWKLLFFETLDSFEQDKRISSQMISEWKDKVDKLKQQLEKSIFSS